MFAEGGEYTAIVSSNEIQMCGILPTSKWLAKTASLPIGQQIRNILHWPREKPMFVRFFRSAVQCSQADFLF